MSKYLESELPVVSSKIVSYYLGEPQYTYWNIKYNKGERQVQNKCTTNHELTERPNIFKFIRNMAYQMNGQGLQTSIINK